ncbi:glycoside hydrolase family 16 protein, partial [Kitasatospora cinereorecta]
RRPGPVAAEPAPSGPSPAAAPGPQGPAARTGPRGPAGRAARRIGVYPPVLLLVLAVTACTNATGRTLSASGSRPAAAADLPPADRLPDLPALPGAWHPVFRDDFDGTALNRADWATCYDWNDGGCTNAGNHELEWYRPGQVHVGDGALTLTADRRATQGGDGHTYPWTSGMVTTGRDSWNGTPRHTFTYGYYAAAIKAPADPAGMFPAFWLIPADSRATPPELDIAEFIHSNQAVDLHMHWRSAAGEDVHDGTRYGPADFAGGYHVFAMDWEPDAVTWYVDGVERYRMDDPSLVPDVPMELVLDLAVGFQAAPPDSVDRTSLQVAWVGVWQH